MTTPLDKERLEALREQYDYDRFCCSCDGCKLEFVFPQMADTIDALLRVNEELRWAAKVNSDEHKQYEDSLKKHLAKLERVAEAALMLECHPSFCVGTRSCEAMPSGVMPRMEDLRKALQSLNRGEGENGR